MELPENGDYEGDENAALQYRTTDDNADMDCQFERTIDTADMENDFTLHIP